MVELETIVSTLWRQLTWSHIGDKFDIEDLLKERLQKGRERLKDALESIEALCETVKNRAEQTTGKPCGLELLIQ